MRGEAELDAALERCRAEARLAFGRDELLAERYVERARHIEVQVIGDGRDVLIDVGSTQGSARYSFGGFSQQCWETLRRLEGQGAGSYIRSEVNTELNFPPNFEGLVLRCIDADFCK